MYIAATTRPTYMQEWLSTRKRGLSKKRSEMRTNKGYALSTYTQNNNNSNNTCI